MRAYAAEDRCAHATGSALVVARSDDFGMGRCGGGLAPALGQRGLPGRSTKDIHRLTTAATTRNAQQTIPYIPKRFR